MQPLTIGRIVIYVGTGGLEYPAIVTYIYCDDAERAVLTVFSVNGPTMQHEVKYSERYEENTWHWPQLMR